MSAEDWTEARVQLLTVLWMRGDSAGMIAKAIGGGITRNAVIGKRIRMGLPDRAPQKAHRTGKKRPPTNLPKKPKQIPSWKPDNHRAKGAEVSEHNVRFIDRASNQCPMFLEGEEGAFGMVCGIALQVDARFCASCSRLVYTPALPQKRRAA